MLKPVPEVFFNTGDYHREPLYEAHDSTFGILENDHWWRFQGSGVIATLHIIGFIFVCTGMHHEYFWGRQCAFVFPMYMQKYRKYTIDRWNIPKSVTDMFVMITVFEGISKANYRYI